MLGKFLVTVVVIYIAYLVVRGRYQGSGPQEHAGPRLSNGGETLLSRGAIKSAAYVVVAVMVFGTGFYLFQSWDRRHQVVEVQVVNPYNGDVQRYEARRGDIEGRTFRTLDGRLIRIAEMERLVINETR
jgi:hypothetical protein